MSKQIFDSVKMTKPNRSTFDLSHDVKLSMKFGGLYPIMVEEVAPGDKFNIGCEALIRFAPMISPVMHRIDCTMHYFFVPMRLLWENFFKWYKGEKDPLTNEPYVHPYLQLENDAGNFAPLFNYLGLPDPETNAGGRDNAGFTRVSAMPMAAYYLIYNEYYRDQNLTQEVAYKLEDGENDASLFNEIFTRAWEHDYFTSALPFAQKGDPVTIPIDGLVTLDPTSNDLPIIRQQGTGTPSASQSLATNISGELGTSPNAWATQIDPNGSLIVNSANATLNDLRISMRVQEWLEKSARGGTRDPEFIRAQFGVKTSDARLQRPEYITGIKTPVTISEVLNTTGTEDAPQGQMAGHGLSVVNGKYGSYYAEEPGYIIGIMNVQPKTAYYQGIPKHFLKINDPTEKLFPVFGNLGEQEIQNQELYAYTAQKEQVLGYIPRYSEYKYGINRVAGEFKTTLNFWHMARKFDSPPALNQTFIECDATDRIFAVQDGTDYLWCHVYNHVKASRLLPFYGTPTF